MLTLDIECYQNYFLVMLQRPDGKTTSFEMLDDKRPHMRPLRRFLQNKTIVTFNGNGYDLPMLYAFLSGFNNAKLKKLSDYLITVDGARWKYHYKFDHDLNGQVEIDHIDLIEVAPGMASLKIYGGRLSAPKMQDLPIEPDAIISKEQAAELRRYCANDLETTRLLLDKLTPQIKLREQMSEEYEQDLRSKSDAQIAEAVINDALIKARVKPSKPVIKPGTAYKYQIPTFIRFDHPELRALLIDIKGAKFKVKENGSIQMPDELNNRKIKIGQSVYKMGIGGLHSCEKRQTVIKPDGGYLIDRDVASYYPAIILGQGLYPKHLTAKFLDIYRSIVERRLAAKASGDKVTADSLKITINGSFGKFGSKYSTLYSPDLLIQTTITGQLALLMLIEQVERVGASVVSANTDGVVILCNDKEIYEKVNDVTFGWEIDTGYETEETRYDSLHSDSVNNYLAVKESGGYKGKGRYASPGLMKNPNNLVCVEAVASFLCDGSPIADWVRNEQDISKFLTIRSVKGGAVSNGQELGKAVRWYYSTAATGQTLNYKTNGNKVPRSDGAKPLMDLPDKFPKDINYDWYINEAQQMLVDMGVIDARESDRNSSGETCKKQGYLDL